MFFQVTELVSHTYKWTYFEFSFYNVKWWSQLIPQKWIQKKSARFLLILQIRVYLFKMGRYCQQVYRSLKISFMRKSAGG